MDDDCTQAEIPFPDSIEMPESPSTSTEIPVSPVKKRSIPWSSESTAKKAKTPILKNPLNGKDQSNSLRSSSPSLSPSKEKSVTNPVASALSQTTTTCTTAYDDLVQMLEKFLTTMVDKDIIKVRKELIAYHVSLCMQRASGVSIDVNVTNAAKVKLLESIKSIIISM